MFNIQNKKVIVLISSTACGINLSLAACNPYDSFSPPEKPLEAQQQKAYEQAAMAGNAEALYQLSLRMPRHNTSLTGYSAGCGTNDEWIDTLTKAAEAGLSDASYDLGVYHAHYGSKEAHPWLKKAAAEKFLPAYKALAIYYIEIEPDQDQAVYWLKKMIEEEQENDKLYDKSREARQGGLYKLSARQLLAKIQKPPVIKPDNTVSEPVTVASEPVQKNYQKNKKLPEKTPANRKKIIFAGCAIIIAMLLGRVIMRHKKTNTKN